MPHFEKRPIKVAAIQWLGGDYDCLNIFCGRNWGRADAQDHAWTADEDGENIVVWNTKSSQWLQVPKGSWIIRGIDGELYPCAPDVFDATYKQV